jgi:hypothetical protein
VIVTRREPPPLPPPPPGPSVSDAEHDAIKAVVTAKSSDLHKCYDDVFAEAKLGSGVVKVFFIVAPHGRVMATAIKEDSFKGAGGVATCIVSEIMRWQFLRSPGGLYHPMLKAWFFKSGPPMVVDQTSDGTFVIDAPNWKALAHNGEGLARGVRLVPTMSQGRHAGWKIYAITPDTAADALGFENGDTVTHLHGVQLTNEAEALRALEGVAGDNETEVRLIRKGKEVVLRYRMAR